MNKNLGSTNPRLIAMQVLQAVLIQGQSLDNSLEQLVPTNYQEASFSKALCFGIVRYYHKLTALAQLLLSKPLKAKDQDVYFLILSGLYELAFMRTAPHAVVCETVSITRACGKPWAAGLVNAVLRGFQRQQEALLTKIETDEAAYYSHPQWFISRLRKAWPAHWQSILDANNQQPAMCLRVNQMQHTREHYLNLLQSLTIHAKAIPYTSNGIILNEPLGVDELPGFNQGAVSVQDGAAQFAAELLELSTGQSVLDACAAPGGKTGHMLENSFNLALLALDIDERRLAMVKENLVRLGVNASLKTADAANLASWWDGKTFDRILLDAPCSGTGVIRRHPDIKVLRRTTDIPRLAQQQLQLLRNLWQTLTPGGILVYVTCSIMPEENAQVVEQFLANQADAKEKRIDAAWGQAMSVGRQILPCGNGMDGFYYARLQKL